MKYTKSIIALLFLNIILIFSMIFIANKTREIEKQNYNLKKNISKITDKIKINRIELLTHQNSSYLKKLYSIYFSELKKTDVPNIVSIKQFVDREKNIKLVNSNN